MVSIPSSIGFFLFLVDHCLDGVGLVGNGSYLATNLVLLNYSILILSDFLLG